VKCAHSGLCNHFANAGYAKKIKSKRMVIGEAILKLRRPSEPDAFPLLYPDLNIAKYKKVKKFRLAAVGQSG